jgi:hypothetical protein
VRLRAGTEPREILLALQALRGVLVLTGGG